jgi:hypothetical protein
MSSSIFCLRSARPPLAITSLTHVSTCARRTCLPAWPSAAWAEAIWRRSAAGGRRSSDRPRPSERRPLPARRCAEGGRGPSSWWRHPSSRSGFRTRVHMPPMGMSKLPSNPDATVPVTSCVPPITLDPAGSRSSRQGSAIGSAHRFAHRLRSGNRCASAVRHSALRSASLVPVCPKHDCEPPRVLRRLG